MTQLEYIHRALNKEYSERNEYAGKGVRGAGKTVHSGIVQERAEWVWDGHYGFGPYFRARNMERNPARYCIFYALIREYKLTPYQAMCATRRWIKANPEAYGELRKYCKEEKE